MEQPLEAPSKSLPDVRFMEPESPEAPGLRVRSHSYGGTSRPLRLSRRDMSLADARAEFERRDGGWPRMLVGFALGLAASLGASVVFGYARGPRPAAGTIGDPIDGGAYAAVVVGAGPAGSVVAARLAARFAGTEKRVLLLESGGGSQRVLGGSDWLFRDRTVFDVPLAWSYVAKLPRYLWSLPGFFLARAVGGCGVHNAMLYVRALQSDVEGWNCSDWTWPAVERRYLEMEDWQGDQGEVDQGWAPASVGMGTPPHHAVGGPLATSGALYRDLLARKFLETVTSPAYGRALPRNFDFNDPDGGRVGAGYYSFNIRDGLRESAAAAMLGAAGAHQVCLQAWWVTLFGLDSVAVSAQALVAASLGKNDVPGARIAADRALSWGVGAGVLVGVVVFLSADQLPYICLLYTSPSPRDATLSRMPSSA